MTTPATIRIFTRLLDCGQECARLWHYLRSLDIEGCGRVLFNRLWLAQQMGVSVRTVQRWLKQGIERGWFRRIVQTSRNITTIYLTGIKAMYTKLGLTSLGAIAEVGIEHLGRSSAKAVSTALEAQHRQRQAYWAAKRAAKGRRKQLVLNPDKMASSENVPGAKSHVVISAPFSIPGCSHAGLAMATDWSQATIKRRLNNRWRSDRGLDTIEKRRVAIELDDPALLFDMQQSGQSFLVKDNGAGCRRVFKVLTSSGRSQVVRLGCNIYRTGYELLSCPSLRKRVRPEKDASRLDPAQV